MSCVDAVTPVTPTFGFVFAKSACWTTPRSPFIQFFLFLLRFVWLDYLGRCWRRGLPQCIGFSKLCLAIFFVWSPSQRSVVVAHTHFCWPSLVCVLISASKVFDNLCTRFSMFGELHVYPKGVPSPALSSPLRVGHTPYPYLGWGSLAVEPFLVYMIAALYL